MTKLRVKLRKEREDVHPAKVLVVEITRCRLDDPVHRRTPMADSPLVSRSLDLDRRNHRAADRHPTRILVARYTPRVLVRGGAS